MDMLLGTRKTLFDHITEALLAKPSSVADLALILNTKNAPATVQGIYKTLRELIAEDIVVKQKKTYLINSVWRNKLNEIVSQKSPFKLFPSEQVTYRFNNIEHTDAFWKHTFQDIAAEVESFPIFHFTPHQYWLMIPSRRQSEEDYYARYDAEKIYCFSIIGGISLFDTQRKKDLTTPFHQVTADATTSFNRRDHLSVIGPYIITTRVAVSFARVTDQLYEACKTESELAEKLVPVFEKSGSIIMTVEHDEAKAKKLRKQMSKEFYINAELREKFDLY